MVKAQDIIKQALALDPSRRFEVVEEILHSLDQPDPAIDAIWQQEAERRLAAHRAGQVQGVPAEDIFGSF
ncbi:addiction module protein [Thermomonas sp. LB-4]|jgi:putative addiction module component (TIGR02574 family)|uniref:addiction module protein n=1 Tax=Thermomonas sp. LB-4 TaxID=3102790 RepID=UPI002ED79659